MVDQKFREWTEEKSPVEARVSIFEHIRDIPYAIDPELTNPVRYAEMLKLGRGSCMPKHLLLSDMYQRLGLMVLLAVYPFRWADIELDYPPRLRELAMSMPPSMHLACKVEIEGRLVLVDATVDLALEKLGVPVNREWDGIGDTVLPIEPLEEEQLYYPSEVVPMDVSLDNERLAFYDGLNSWLAEIRKGCS